MFSREIPQETTQSSELYKAEAVHSFRTVGAGGSMATPDFGRSLNPISIRCVRLCPSHYYLPPKFSDLPRALSSRVRPSVRLSVLPCLCPSSSSHRLVSGTILCNEKEASLTSVRPRKQAEAAILLASPTMKVFRLKPGDFPFYKQVSRYVRPSRMCDERPPLLAAAV